jgi:hypothetical protein
MSPGIFRLGQVAARFERLDFVCNRCGRRSELDTGQLVAEYGPDIPTPQLISVLSADCSLKQTNNLYDPCGLYCPQFSQLD